MGFGPDWHPEHTARMNITLQEAISILEMWQREATAMRVSFSGRGGANSREWEARVSSISGTSVTLAASSQQINVEIASAEFNGDARAPESAKHGAYLVCEFPNQDRWSFYASR